MLDEAERRRYLHEELRRRTGHRRPRQRLSESLLVLARSRPQQHADHHDVPQHRREIRQRESAMAVEDAEAPGREHEDAGARPQNAREMNRQLTALATEAG